MTGLGSYLVNTGGGCNDHTHPSFAPGGDPFKGETGFEHLLRTGEDDGEILQVMPWNVYGKMTRLDLRAIYEYLSAIPVPDNPEPGP